MGVAVRVDAVSVPSTLSTMVFEVLPLGAASVDRSDVVSARVKSTDHG
jgi:hypothetical protein